jgi:hypothetical protein
MPFLGQDEDREISLKFTYRLRTIGSPSGGVTMVDVAAAGDCGECRAGCNCRYFHSLEDGILKPIMDVNQRRRPACKRGDVK